MSVFYRIGTEVDENDYLRVIGMIVSKVTYRKTINDEVECTFFILQDESHGCTKVTYISRSPKEELKLFRLYKVFGTLVYMTNIVKLRDGFELDYDEEMAVIAFRPNVYQANKFLEEIV